MQVMKCAQPTLLMSRRNFFNVYIIADVLNIMETFYLNKQVLYVHTNEVFSTVSHEIQVKLTTLSGSCNAIYLH